MACFRKYKPFPPVLNRNAFSVQYAHINPAYFFSICPLVCQSFQSCEGFLFFWFYKWQKKKKFKTTERGKQTVSLITAKYCKGYWLACLFFFCAAVSSPSCLQHLFSFLERNLPCTGRKKKTKPTNHHQQKKTPRLSSSVINTGGSELKTIPVIQKEVSAV